MKKIGMIMMALCLSVGVMGQKKGDQTDVATLTYDFATKSFGTIDDMPRYNRPFRLKVVNVNRYLYNVDISADQVEFGSEEPALWQQFFGGSVGGLLENVATVVEESKGAESLLSVEEKGNKGVIPRPKSARENLMADIEAFEAELDKLTEVQLKAHRVCTTDAGVDCPTEGQTNFSNLSKQLRDLQASYAKYQIEQHMMITEKEKLLNRLKECIEVQDQIAALEKALKAATKEIEKKQLREQIAALTPCGTTESDVKDAEAELQAAQIIKNVADSTWKSFEKPTKEAMMEAVLFKDNFVSQHFSYLSPPIYPKGSLLNIGLHIYPSDSSLTKKRSSTPLLDDSLGIELRVRNKWKVSFSSGPFAVFMDDNDTKHYEWQRQPDDDGVVTDSSRYKLVSSGKGSVPVGLAAFANLGTMLTDGFGLGFSLGVGVAISDDPKPVYMLGGSMMLGQKQQFNLSVGLSLMQVDKLRDELYPDMADQLYQSPQDLSYRQVLTPGCFVSLSYTIYTLERIKGVKAKSTK